MGVVYHGNYIPYFEYGKVEWLRNKGFHINAWRSGIMFL
jgi:acyl-CoA thioesterase FadM